MMNQKYIPGPQGLVIVEDLTKNRAINYRRIHVIFLYLECYRIVELVSS